MIYGKSFTLFLLLLNVKQGSCEYQFLVFGLTQPGIETKPTVSETDALSTRSLICLRVKLLIAKTAV